MWLIIAGWCVAAVVASAVCFLVFSWAWYSWGLFGACLLVTAILLGVGYVHDRRQQKRYAA